MMPKRSALSGLRDEMKKKQTRRALFLAEMDNAARAGAGPKCNNYLGMRAQGAMEQIIE